MNKVIRYIGSKEKLLPFLSEKIFNKYKNKEIKFFDGFSGTSVVSKYCQNQYNWNQYLSDMSDYSEVLASRLYLSKCSPIIFECLNELNNLKGIEGLVFNELSINGEPKTINKEFFLNQEIKSRMFFTDEVGKKIDAMKKYIKDLYESGQINKYDKNILLMYVMAFADKNANTTSIYGAYLKKQNRPIINISESLILNLKDEYKKGIKAPNDFIKGDIISNLEKVNDLDIAYLDPPYTTRRYESNYHILNYLCDLNFNIDKIKENSKTALPSNQVINLFGSKKGTREIFKKMIELGSQKSKEMFISYSTDGEMAMDEISDICSDNNLILNMYTQDYKKYRSNKNNKDLSIKEIIYHIKRK